MSIEVDGVTKTFQGFAALRDVNLHVASGELVALLGPSGCGKTTLLRIIAGLEMPDAGRVRFEGEDATDRSVRERQVGFVFQHYALFKHMTVFENVAFGLRVRPRRYRPSRAEIRERVLRLLRLVQLDWAGERFPSELSGGQRQRIALARALAVEPRVLLLDEPFGALDAKVRRELRRWLRRLHDELHVTSVFVTHDQEEALEVADQVVVMNHGRIEQIGRPRDVYDRPATPFVYDFLGNVNRFSGSFRDGRAFIGETEIRLPDHPCGDGDSLVAFVRPHDLVLERTRSGTSAFPAEIAFVNDAGPVVRVELRRRDTGDLIEAELTREAFRQLAFDRGDRVFVTPRLMSVFVGDRDTHGLTPATGKAVPVPAR